MANPFRSLHNATEEGPGTVFDPSGVRAAWAIQAVKTGTSSGCKVRLEGSLDGVSWFNTNLTVDLNGGGLYTRSDYPLPFSQVRLYLFDLSDPSEDFAVTAWVAGAVA